jgi:menaquinone-dependent protoporphyrinogen oxidase
MKVRDAERTLTGMSDLLVVYASTHGHTGRIAERIADVVRAEGVSVELATAGADPEALDHDAVVAGGSIHAGHHQRELVEWVRRHRATLRCRPAALFTVCLTAADDTDEARAATRTYLDEFVEATDWTPEPAVTFAGALQYREYDFMTRLMMRLLMLKGHHPTDTSRDHDFTDWDAVERFARVCADLHADRRAHV